MACGLAAELDLAVVTLGAMIGSIYFAALEAEAELLTGTYEGEDKALWSDFREGLGLPQGSAAVPHAPGARQDIPNVTPADWWRALMITAYMTGWR
jgi:hypothetical protein